MPTLTFIIGISGTGLRVLSSVKERLLDTHDQVPNAVALFGLDTSQFQGYDAFSSIQDTVKEEVQEQLKNYSIADRIAVYSRWRDRFLNAYTMYHASNPLLDHVELLSAKENVYLLHQTKHEAEEP